MDFTELCKEAVSILSMAGNPLELVVEARKKAGLAETPNVIVTDAGVFWDDLSNANGWRVQQNKVSKHFRLLSPESKHHGNAYETNFSQFLSNIIKLGARQASTVIVMSQPLPPSDRRTIVVIADNTSPKAGGVVCCAMTQAKKLFKFPPNHPTPGTAYAMIDVKPDSYVLLNGFHDYYKQIKHMAFIELCASLGAKEILIESAEINNQELNINADVKTPLSKLGLGLSISQNRETGQTVAFKFSEKNREIKDYDSPWLYTEPSWMNMNNLRRRNHLAELGAEFTCLDDMGINANLTAKLSGVGVNIGGSFKEMTKIRLSYKVVFWE